MGWLAEPDCRDCHIPALRHAGIYSADPAAHAHRHGLSKSHAGIRRVICRALVDSKPSGARATPAAAVPAQRGCPAGHVMMHGTLAGCDGGHVRRLLPGGDRRYGRHCWRVRQRRSVTTGHLLSRRARPRWFTMWEDCCFSLCRGCT